LEIIFSKNKIIINYPFNPNVNSKYISAIGTVNIDNSFITEYILIYDQEKHRDSHISNIQYNLDDYLNSMDFTNNRNPIFIKDYNYKDIEIGTIVKLEGNKDNENNSTINNMLIEDKKDEKKENQNEINMPENFDKIVPNKKLNEEIYDKDININIQEEPKPISYKIRDLFKSSPLIGLRNIGATCYMNSTLQCFCHIEKFVDFFKARQKSDKENLSSSFKLLIDNLWPNDYNNNTKDYAPEEFKEKISKLNPLFEGIAANDAKDLVTLNNFEFHYFQLIIKIQIIDKN
jgi:hypothetical protein